VKQPLLLVALIPSIAGCLPEPGATEGGQWVAVANGPLEFRFPAGWYRNPEDNPYDLQYFSGDRHMNAGVFQFARADLAEEIDARRLLELQVDDMKAKRKNFKLVEDERTIELTEKKLKLTTVVYSGEKDMGRYYYKFTLVELSQSLDTPAVLLQVALPSEWANSKPILEEITESARVRSVETK